MITNSISFGRANHHYQSPLKTLFKEGKFPSVTRGFYGEIITPRNVSLEHLKPFSSCRRNDLSNLVLASKRKNTARGCGNLSNYFNPTAAQAYLEQFRDIHIPGKFDGNSYINMITRKLRDMSLFMRK